MVGVSHIKVEMKNILIMLTVGLLSLGTHAEVIDGPANIRVDANATIIASINDGVEVEIQNSGNNWNDVAIFITVRESSLASIGDGVGLVKENEILYDLKYREAGVSKEKLKLFYFSKEKTGFYSGFFRGKAHKQNINPNSIPELELRKILKRNDGSFPRSAFDDYINRLGYKKWIDDENFETYILYTPSSLDPSAGARNILVFNKKQLLAVIFSSEYNLDYLESKDFVHGYGVSIVNNDNPLVVDAFNTKYSEIIKNAD